MRVFVGLGEGLGNVLMGVPVIDSLEAAGHEVTLGLRTTPPGMGADLGLLIARGRKVCLMVDEAWPAEPFDAACLTWWWLSRGGEMPPARDTFLGPAMRDDVPEILQNLDTVTDLVPEALRTSSVSIHHVLSAIDGEGPVIAIHPGCKPAWRDRKLYPRWAEVVTHLKRMGAAVVVVGGADDADIFCGEPHEDLREQGASLETTAAVLASCDAVLSGDSGVHHMAVALGLPAVAVFGATSHVKAHHPSPRGPKPVVLGPFPDAQALARVHPQVIARAALRAASSSISA